jgi:hypothetical protein
VVVVLPIDALIEPPWAPQMRRVLMALIMIVVVVMVVVKSQLGLGRDV